MKRLLRERTDCRHLWLVLCLSFCIRGGAAWWWQSRLPDATSFALPDSESYWYLGRALARGEPYAFPDARFRVFRAPAYPLWLSLWLRIWPGDELPVIVVRLWGAFLGTVVVYQAWRLGRRLYGPHAAIVAGVLVAGYPGAVSMSILVLSESLFVPLMLSAVLAWAWASDGTGYWDVGRRAGAAGVWSGLAALTRPSWLLFVPLACVLAGVDGRLSVQKRAALVAGTLAGLVLTMSPWWIRNAHCTGHFVPTTLQVGASLYDGLNPRADGGSDMWFADAFRRRVASGMAVRGGEADGDFEWQLDREYRRAAWAWARAHPWRALHLGLIKLRRTWQPWPQGGLVRSSAVASVVAFGYVTIFLFGMAGWIATRGRGWIVWLPLVYIAYTAALHVVFVGSIRYRQPAMVWWSVPAAWAMWWLWERLGSARGDGTTHRQVGHERR